MKSLTYRTFTNAASNTSAVPARTSSPMRTEVAVVSCQVISANDSPWTSMTDVNLRIGAEQSSLEEVLELAKE